MGTSQFNIYGQVTLDTGPAAAGVKQVGSEIQNLAQTGIAGFEQVRSRLIAATREVVNLRKELQAATDPRDVARLNAALGKAQGQMNLARTEMRGMSMATRQTTESASMLAAQLGIQLPMGLERLIARMPMVQGAMAAAFSATVILAVGAAIVTVIAKGDEWLDKLRGIEAASADVFKEVAKANETLQAFGKPGSTEALRREIAGVGAEIYKVQQHIKSLETLPQTGLFSPGMWLINRKEIGLLEDQLKNLTARQKELELAIPVEKIKEQTEALKEAGEAAKRLRTQQQESLAAWSEAQVANQETLRKMTEETQKLELDTDKYFQEQRHKMAMEDIRDQESAIGEAERRSHVQLKTLSDAAREIQAQNREVASLVEARARHIESFIDRVFIHARSLSDVFHQFLMQLLGSFAKWVSREIALAWSGMKQMTGAQAGGGGGGIFGSLLGSMFGLGSAGVSPALGYAAGTAALPGGIGIEGITGGLTSGAIAPYGAGAGGIPGAAGGASSGVFGRLAFGKASLEELMASGLPSAGMILGGGALLGSAFGAGGPVKGAIGGGLVGLGIAGLLGVGLFGGPIGLAIAGIAAGIGALIGAWGRGRAKEKATEIEQGVEFAANDLYAQFRNFETDYQSALAGMQALIQQGQQAELASGTGKWGQKGAENLTRVIQDEITALNNLQRQRETSANVLGGMSIPEFAVGGQVLGVGSGVLAILHPGEFVMQRSAVDALGANFLAALNRAPRFDSGGSVGPGLASPTALHIGTINVYPERGMSRREAMNMVVTAVRDAQADGAI